MLKLNSIISLFLYAGCKDEKEFKSILPDIHKVNRSNLKIATLTLSVFMLSLIIISNFFLFYYDFSLNYIMIFSVISILTFFLWYLPEEYNYLSQTILYFLMAIIYFFGIGNGIVIPSEPAVNFIVVLIAMPLVFIDRPIRTLFISLIAMAAFILSVIMVKPLYIVAYDITNVLIYGAFGIILGTHITYIKVSKLLTDKKLILLSETDLLTGLKNRNSYEENLLLYPERCSSTLTCVYMDANGLHELNNTKGHKAGDDMLCSIADLLKSRFYSHDIYRIGGDEFVVFVIDDINENVPNIMQDISDKLEEKDYHISWGLSTMPVDSINMTDLIISTEQKMYQAKFNYYKTKGIDRRKPRA